MVRAVLDEPDPAEATQAVDAVVRDYLREAVQDGSARGGSWPSVRLAVSRGVPGAVIVRSLWQAHMRLMDGLLEPGATGATDAARRALTSFTFYCCEDVARAYGSQELATQGEQERRVLVEQILYGAGDDIDVGEVERELGVCSSDNHWATVLSSTRNPGLETEDLVRFAVEIARSVGGSEPLVVPDHESEVWMWTRWSRPPRSEVVDSACAELRLPEGLQVCSGPVLPGLSGFRRSMLVARATRKTVGVSPDTRWHHHAETSPVSWLIDDREWAHWFVEDTLGALGRGGVRNATLRETLRLYLAHGRSRQQVAAVMYINRNTVAYRVQKAEELLGRRIDEDTFELRLALEIVRASGPGWVDQAEPEARTG